MSLLKRLLLSVPLLCVAGCILVGCGATPVIVTSDPPGAKAFAGPTQVRSYVGTDTNDASFIGVTPARKELWGVWNEWGRAYAYVEWPDGTKSRIKRRQRAGTFAWPPAEFHFVKTTVEAKATGSVEKISPAKQRILDETRPPPEVAQRWAVVIGISKYQNSGKSLPELKYAHRDAEKLAAFLKSRAGGGFADDHVKLLTDRKATTRNIREALFDFLKKTVKEDLVIIFFAGHGIPDPDKPSNLYLVGHDSDPNKIASTGFPMWDLDTALKRTIAAERVVVLVDACHSAGAAEGIRGVKIGDSFNKYFDQLTKAKRGRVVFTSCEGYEVSREAKKWGGGHGVFTWALLEGLKGKADKDNSGIVTLGEVLDYVDITVRRETANEQHPTKAGVRFDRKLPMGVVK